MSSPFRAAYQKGRFPSIRRPVTSRTFPSRGFASRARAAPACISLPGGALIARSSEPVDEALQCAAIVGCRC